jgi:hypothetical protein
LTAACSLAPALPAWSQVLLGPPPDAPVEKDATKQDELAGTTRTVIFRADAEIGDHLARAMAFQRNRDYKEAFEQ